MNLIIASNNKHKIEEISAILAEKFDNIFSLADMGIVCDPDENGSTFLENALIKAKAVAHACKLLSESGCKNANFCDTNVANVMAMSGQGSLFASNLNRNAILRNYAVLADDTGLCVDALGGEPGIHSARYAESEMGEAHDDAANRAKLLRELQKVCSSAVDEHNSDSKTWQELRKAHFECVVVLLDPNGQMYSAVGRVDGRILEEERGENGFGYDSLFFCDELGKTFAEATEEEKNSISHRGRALANLIALPND